MAIHPPTLFIGYAGFTIPFAFSIASLIVNDPSAKWVNRARPYALFSWLFLSIGIGLGSVWAYVVLGWGGYWGWDAVENASLLSWLVGLALIHSMTVCRQRAAFKRWTIMCACITFAFVIAATFITRSGIVQSVHAFDGNSVSFALFAALIIVSILFGIIGLAVRWKSFSSSINETDKVESLLTKEGAYYFNNVIMLVAAVLLAYLTISSALPSFLPFGGSTVSTGTYNAIARPLGIVYLLILSCCPLLSWGKTLRSKFWRQARIPALCAILLFIVLAIYWANCLLPSYNSIIAAGGTSADELLSEGPAWYYNGLALFGFFVASLVFFNSLFMLGRTLKRSTNGTRKNGVRKNDLQKQDKATVAEATMPPDHTKNDTPKKDTQKKTAKKHGQAARFGGFLAHAALGIILIGLIGSSMYVTQVTQYVSYDEETNTSTDDIHIQDYTLKYVSNSITAQKSDATVFYNVTFDVYKGDNYLGQVNPNVQLSMKTQQQKLNVATLSFPTHDLFVVYQGANDDGALSMNVRINPLISFVWVGFGLLVVGMLIAAFGAIFKRRKAQKEGRAGSKATVSHENINDEHHTQIEQS